VNEDKSVRYHRTKRRAALLGAVWRALWLSAFFWSGLSMFLRDAVNGGSFDGSTPLLGVASYTAVLLALDEIGMMPLALYRGFLLDRRYGLSEQSAKSWVSDQMKSIALGAVLGVAAAVVLYAIIGEFPSSWWLVAGGLFALVVAGLTRVGPVILLPLFYSTKPLERIGLTARLIALASRAGASVVGVFEWCVSPKTRKANAALVGLGSTRRILVSDTMLAAYSEDEVEVVLAHELGHHVHGDIWKGLAVQSAVIAAGFVLAAWCLSLVGDRASLAGPADVAGLPVVVLAVGAVSAVSLPVQLAFSRYCERQADRFALELTRNPEAFVSTMRRLGAQNLAEEQPSTVVRWFFYSHPPIRERIASARAFKTNEGPRTMAVASR
jgi:STE24 endopeptidase